MARICIPDYEYKERVKKCAAILVREGLDVLIVNGNEADYANPRYFSGFWPLFERSGVAISADGRAALMVGPESAIFGADPNWGRIISAVGTTGAQFDPTTLDVAVNGVMVCRNAGIGEDRALVSFADREVHVDIYLKAGEHEVTIWTNDLSYDYVRENAEYSS